MNLWQSTTLGAFLMGVAAKLMLIYDWGWNIAMVNTVLCTCIDYILYFHVDMTRDDNILIMIIIYIYAVITFMIDSMVDGASMIGVRLDPFNH